MSYHSPLKGFFAALNQASKDDLEPLREYLSRLGARLNVAAQCGECPKFGRHVELLLITVTLVSICGWMPRYWRWSRRLERMLSAQMPGDLRQALRRIDLKCRHRPPRQRVIIRAPARWQARSWTLEPVRWEQKKRQA